MDASRSLKWTRLVPAEVTFNISSFMELIMVIGIGARSIIGRMTFGSPAI
jgi:hypothetical protein